MKGKRQALYFFVFILLCSCSIYQETSISALRANQYHDKKIKVQVLKQKDTTYQIQNFLFKRYEFESDSLIGYHKFWSSQSKSKLSYHDIQSVKIKNTLLSDLGTIGIVIGGIGITLGVLAAITLSQTVPD